MNIVVASVGEHEGYLVMMSVILSFVGILVGTSFCIFCISSSIASFASEAWKEKGRCCPVVTLKVNEGIIFIAHLPSSLVAAAAHEEVEGLVVNNNGGRHRGREDGILDHRPVGRLSVYYAALTVMTVSRIGWCVAVLGTRRHVFHRRWLHRRSVWLAAAVSPVLCLARHQTNRYHHLLLRVFTCCHLHCRYTRPRARARRRPKIGILFISMFFYLKMRLFARQALLIYLPRRRSDNRAVRGAWQMCVDATAVLRCDSRLDHGLHLALPR